MKLTIIIEGETDVIRRILAEYPEGTDEADAAQVIVDEFTSILSAKFKELDT